MDEIRNQFVQSLPAKLIALDMAKRRLKQNSPEAVETIKRIAFTLKGAGRANGFPELSGIADAIQSCNRQDLSELVQQLLDHMREIVALQSAKSVRILIIENNQNITTLLKGKLQTPNRKIMVARTGKDALKKLRQYSVDLITMDLVFPDMNGLDLLAKLRTDPATSTVPIIILTAEASPHVQSECYALGIDGFFEKLFHPDVVAAAISAALERTGFTERDSRYDIVTGLPNKAAFQDTFRRERAYARRENTPLSLGLLDLDHFGELLKKRGRSYGDDILRAFSRLMQETLRESDFLARHEADKFTVLWPNTPLDGALRAADKVRLQVEQLGLEGDTVLSESERKRLTLSVGIAEVTEGSSFSEIMAEAERHLYLAKIAGRNRVVCSDDVGNTVRTRKILLAEDDELSATIVKRQLTKAGFRVQHVSDGTEALKQIEIEEYDLFILDVKMPGADGFEVLETLRSMEKYQETPIIILSAMGSERDIVRGLDSGADDYITKPFSPAELASRVQRLIRIRQTNGS